MVNSTTNGTQSQQSTDWDDIEIEKTAADYLDEWGISHGEGEPYKSGTKWTLKECPLCHCKDAYVYQFENTSYYTKKTTTAFSFKCNNKEDPHEWGNQDGWDILKMHFEIKSQQNDNWDDIEADDKPDYDTLAREHCYKYLFNGIVKREAWPECGFGEYESAIAQHEEHIDKFPTMTPQKIKEKIKIDIRLKHLFEDDDDETEKPETCPELPEHIRIPQETKNLFNQSDTYRLMQSYIEFSKKCSPRGYKDFHPYCFLWLLSVIAARRIWFQFGRKKVYTNLRITLCGGSTSIKKSFTAEVATSVLIEDLRLGYLLIETDDMTPEALITKMMGKRIIPPDGYEQLKPEEQEKIKTKLAWCSVKSMYWDEFGMFLRKISKGGDSYAGWVELLLKLEECKNVAKDTIARDDEIVEKPYLPFLGNCVPKTLKKIAGEGSDAWLNGTLPRQLFACQPEGEKNDDRTKVQYHPAPSELIAELLQWHDALDFPEADVIDKNAEKRKPEDKSYTPKWQGVLTKELPEHQIHWNEKAEEMWYEYGYTLENLAEDKSFPQDLKPHYTGRLTANMLRIAMLFACIDNRYGRIENTIITELHMAIAQELIEIARQGLHRFYEQANGFKTFESQIETEVMRVFRRMSERAKTDAKRWFSPSQIRKEINEKYGTEQINKVLKTQTDITLEHKAPRQANSKGTYRLIPGR